MSGTWRMTSLSPGHKPPHVIMAALTCSTTKLDQSSGSSLTRMSKGRYFHSSTKRWSWRDEQNIPSDTSLLYRYQQIVNIFNESKYTHWASVDIKICTKLKRETKMAASKLIQKDMKLFFLSQCHRILFLYLVELIVEYLTPCVNDMIFCAYCRRVEVDPCTRSCPTSPVESNPPSLDWVGLNNIWGLRCGIIATVII